MFHDLDLENTGIDVGRIHSLEHRFERASAWEPPRDQNGNPSPLPFSRVPYWKERHEGCREEVRRLLARNSGLRSRVLNYLSQQPRKTILVSEFDYFNCLYVLNQFLALLLIESCSDKPGSVQLFSESTVTAIKDAGNPPLRGTLTADRCLGHPSGRRRQDTWGTGDTSSQRGHHSAWASKVSSNSAQPDSPASVAQTLSSNPSALRQIMLRRLAVPDQVGYGCVAATGRGAQFPFKSLLGPLP